MRLADFKPIHAAAIGAAREAGHTHALIQANGVAFHRYELIATAAGEEYLRLNPRHDSKGEYLIRLSFIERAA